MTISVLVVDDQPLIRRAVTDILAAQSDLDVVGEASNGLEATAAATRLHPDVIVMDIRMPELDGIAATAQICADPDLAETRVLILTTFEEDEYIVAALRAGASGFVGKAAEPDDLARAVRAVHAGDALLSPAATRALIDRFTATPARPGSPTGPAPDLAQLTDREQEVLTLVAQGRSNADIAADLVISPHTAKTHVHRIMTKLHAHDRAQLVVIAYEGGIAR